MSEREQEIRVSLHADKMLRMALDNKNKIMSENIKNEITDLNIIIAEQKKELEWYRAYGSYINIYHPKVDAEGAEYADYEANL
tara:strand:+ start:87 stop:335 length:249 start_codon:yes stop_codon:yes gene_type:complete